jgi:small basic protein
VILFPFFALLLGVLLAYVLQVGPLTGQSGMYIAIACLAGFDTVCGGMRSGLEGKFHNDVFITGFISNVLIAFFLAWLGDQIGINLLLATAVVLGMRIFTNLSLIRRILLTRWQDARERQRVRQKSQATS